MKKFFLILIISIVLTFCIGINIVIANPNILDSPSHLTGKVVRFASNEFFIYLSQLYKEAEINGDISGMLKAAITADMCRQFIGEPLRNEKLIERLLRQLSKE